MKPIRLLMFALLLALPSTQAAPLGTAFTYQGYLADDGIPANGIYDLRFTIYDLSANGTLVAGPLTLEDVSVTNGLFTALLDFGSSPFIGDARWLEIAVRPGASRSSFSVLEPRQPLLASPHALYAAAAGHALSTTNVLANGVGTAALQDSSVTGAKLADGAAVRSLNGLRDDVRLAVEGDLLMRTAGNQIVLAPAPANCLTYSNCYWNLLGNGNITPGVNFLGTIAGELAPLEFRVNDHRTMLYEFTGAGTAPNITGGYEANAVAGVASTIAGGGAAGSINQIQSDYGAVGGGRGNVIEVFSDHGAIGGGMNNVIQQSVETGTIGGGSANTLRGPIYSPTIGGGLANYIAGVFSATIGGGEHNTNLAAYATIGGGRRNTVSGGSATVGGGEDNDVRFGATGATIGGGRTSVVQLNSTFATVGGGIRHVIESNTVAATVSGGATNTIRTASSFATIGGGADNLIGTNSPRSTIGGGHRNFIDQVSLATISGGGSNRIQTTAIGATIGGGYTNIIQSAAPHATIAGGLANLIRLNSPAGVIGGGNGNRLGSPFATIGGGGFNDIGVNSHSATIAGGTANEIGPGADYGAIGGGNANEILGISRMDVIAGGFDNTIGTNTVMCAIGGGSGNTIEAGNAFSTVAGGGSHRIGLTAISGTVGGGSQNTIFDNVRYATIPGGYQAAATNYGQHAYASGHFANNGDAQTSVYVVRNITTGTNATELYLDGVGARIRVRRDSTWVFDIMVVGRTSGTFSAAYHFRGTIENNGGATALDGALLSDTLNEDVALWNAEVLANNVDDALVVRVSGSGNTTVRWVATVRTTEVMFP